MGVKTPEDIVGLEYDWLAVDRDGHVGVFSTAGGGRAPHALLADSDAHDAGLDALLASPCRTSARFFPRVAAGLENIWKEVAERGVFAFDSDAESGPYRLVAAPEAAVGVRHVPEITARAAATVQFQQLSFGDIRQGETLMLE